MASPKRETWIDLAADTSWTPSHVSEGELFPEPLVGHLGVAASAWESWKVPAAPGFGAHLTAIAPLPIEPFSIAHAHAPSGHEAARVQARLLRFSRAGGQRRLALFGLLDEVQRAHGQRLA
ncbi:MAG TPA: hypothetical protein VGG33_18520, partial [Polyangia bacterium]